MSVSATRTTPALLLVIVVLCSGCMGPSKPPGIAAVMAEDEEVIMLALQQENPGLEITFSVRFAKPFILRLESETSKFEVRGTIFRSEDEEKWRVDLEYEGSGTPGGRPYSQRGDRRGSYFTNNSLSLYTSTLILATNAPLYSLRMKRVLPKGD